MIKIGDFSKLGQVTVKTLRFYDEVGLLQPERVDAFTGYRYYAFEQLTRLNTILALKDLGLSLEQIRDLLAQGLPPEQLRGMLRLKLAEIGGRVQDEQARLARVAARLRQIEREPGMANYEVVVKRVPPQTVAAIHTTLPNYAAVGTLFQEIIGQLAGQGARVLSTMGLYYDPEYKEEDVDVEAAVGTDPGAQGTERVRVYALPETPTMATAIHQGPYDQVHNAYGALLQWIGENGYQVAGPVRELYLRGPFAEPDPANYVTEVQVPVTKGA